MFNKMYMRLILDFLIFLVKSYFSKDFFFSNNSKIVLLCVDLEFYFGGGCLREGIILFFKRRRLEIKFYFVKLISY